MTDIAAAIDAIVTHCLASGTTLNPPITDVARADPLPTGRCIRVWYGGETDPPSMYQRNTGNSELVGQIVHVDIFWPVSDQGTTVTSNRDHDVFTIGADIRTRINAHSQLGGTVQDLEMKDWTSQFVLYGGAMFRTLQCEIHLSYSEYTTSP